MATDSPPQRTAAETTLPQAKPAAARKALRPVRRHVFRYFADRTKRRRLLLVTLTLIAFGLLAAAKGIIGYYVFATKSTRFEVGLAILAVLAAVFVVLERRVARSLESRFTRNTQKHRAALASLVDEISVIGDPAQLEQRLVARFDELFGTSGTVLFVGGPGRPFSVVAGTNADMPSVTGDDDPVVAKLRQAHAPAAPADLGSSIKAPLVWPLRVRGELIGMLASGHHDYIESFDAAEIEGVTTLADAAAANLALLDSSLVAAPATPHNLPPQLASFVGRERELAQCRKLLQESRLLTLTGFGGAGKTRLAHRLAEDLLDQFPGGVWWVDLAGLADPDHLASAVAAVVGVPEMQGVSATQGLSQRFGNRSVLLVLDTCEHVRDGCRRLVEELIGTCGKLAVLATSQEPLGVAGEREFPLPTLAVPPADDEIDAQALAQSAAVRLFIDRARVAVPEFAPDTRAVATIADICRQLDGIPLAIELAAARVKFLALDAIRDHLDDRFRLLGGGNKTLARHQTMRASIEWSHDHLDADEQQLLRRLAAFAGSFTLSAAAKVAHGADDPLEVLDGMTRLVDKSLLQVEHGSDGPRYRMLATMRQFAQEKLAASTDDTVVRRRHRDFYVAFAEDTAKALHGPEARDAGDRLDREFDNLMIAHAFCAQDPQGGHDGMRLAHALELYWLDRGLLARGSQAMREALGHPDAAAPSRMRAALLLGAARHALMCGDAPQARMRLEECVTLASAQGAEDLRCRALALAGDVAQRNGDVAGARRALDEAVRAARALGDASVLRETLDDAGEFHRNAGDLAAAAAALEESLALARDETDMAALHVCLRDLARLALERHDLARARDLLREALDLALTTGARFDGENDLEVAGELAAACEAWPRAARFAGAADASAAAMGSSRATRDDAITAAFGAAPRAAMGAEAFAVAYAQGQKLRLAEALAEARRFMDDGWPEMSAEAVPKGGNATQ
jgi:non-specific serine/threonine protein kinase